MTADEFRKRVAAARSAHTSGKPDQGWTHQERFAGGLVRPYYDWDAKYETLPEDLEEEKSMQFLNFKAVLRKLHPKDVHPDAVIHFAERHGPLEGAGKYVYKISFRAFVAGVAMEVSHIPVHARRALGLGAKDAHPHLDLSVFKEKEQLLGVIYGSKDTDKVRRYLIPKDPATDPCEFLAQYVTEDAVVFKPEGSAGGVSMTTEAKPKSKRGRKPKSAGEASGASSGQSGGTSSSDAGLAEKETFTAAHPQEGTAVSDVLTAATSFFGDKYRLQEDLKAITVDRERKCIIIPTEERWCFISKRRHVSNNPFLVVTEVGARLKCPDDECKARGELPHIPLSELPVVLRDFFTRKFYSHVNPEAMTVANEECKTNITRNFPMEEATETSPLNNVLTTIAHHQKCISCGSSKMQFEHTLRGWYLRCNTCDKPWPSNPIALPEADFPTLYAVLTQMNVAIGTVNINNGTVNNYITTVDEPFVGTYDADGLVLFEDEGLNSIALEALQGTDYGLSALVFALFSEDFHCAKSGAKGTDGMWYHFTNHCWSAKAELVLRQMLGDKAHFQGVFRRASIFYEKHAIQTEDTKRKARHLQRICEQLGDNARRKRILEDAIERFHSTRPKFLELLDTGNTLAFTNGVYDFSAFEFRDGRPEDFISVQLNIPYQPTDQLSDDCAFVMDFMSAIQPDVETRDYLLKVLSLCITTDSSQQLFFIFTGAGANGKSKLMNFLMDTLGEHFGASPAALLTRRREDANQANEALSGLEKCRVAVFSEGASSEILQVNTIKLFSGEDAISTRGLHEKQRRWKPRFVCILVCNDIPRLDENTWAGWRRMRVVHFPTLFVDNPSRPNERQRDSEIGEKLVKRATAFIGILIEYNKRFKTEGLREPDLVMRATQKYQSANDVVAEFCEENIAEGEQGTMLVWKDLYPIFKRWADRNGLTAPTKLKSTPLFNAYFKEEAKTNHCSRMGHPVYGWRDRRVIG